MAQRCWDLTELNHDYVEFVERYRQLMPRFRSVAAVLLALLIPSLRQGVGRRLAGHPGSGNRPDRQRRHPQRPDGPP